VQCATCSHVLLFKLLIDCCSDRSPGDISDDDDARDYQYFSSNDDLSDIDAGDERPAHLSKLHATRSNFSSQVSHFKFVSNFIITAVSYLKFIDSVTITTQRFF